MPDKRLIDADNLARWLQMVLANENPLDRKARAAFSEALARVNTMPVVDAVPVVHGRWALYEGFRACSKCGCSPADWEAKPNNPLGLPPYCHSCGAKMDAKE